MYSVFQLMMFLFDTFLHLITSRVLYDTGVYISYLIIYYLLMSIT